MDCAKCHKRLHECPACKGGSARGMFGMLTCSKCDNTGLLCITHDGAHGRR